ncbi:MAG: SAM-dependent methyltransferase [Ignavibacteriae bacterium]|nr:MAG: SAM-dependent methyltransferase [Ignavibacteriota bacterium]
MNEILKCLEAILRRGYSSEAVFIDWLDLILFTMQRDDEHYLEIVRRYGNEGKTGERVIDYFAKAFTALLKIMQETNDDILGELYMQWNMANKFRGQYFTPKQVAEFMAKAISPQGGKILDPACGSGIMLISCFKTMTNAQLDEAVFYGQDIDLTCVKMCALNLLFFNVNGVVVWGDTLAFECKKAYETKRSMYGGVFRELTGRRFEVFKESYIESVKQTSNPSSTVEETDDEATIDTPFTQVPALKSEQLPLF